MMELMIEKAFKLRRSIIKEEENKKLICFVLKEINSFSKIGIRQINMLA
jgi:hypothetical protein